MKQSEYMNLSTLQYLRAASLTLSKARSYGLLTDAELEAVKTLAEAEIRLEKEVDGMITEDDGVISEG